MVNEHLTLEARAALANAGGVPKPSTVDEDKDFLPNVIDDVELRTIAACVDLLWRLDHSTRIRATEYLDRRAKLTP